MAIEDQDTQDNNINPTMETVKQSDRKEKLLTKIIIRRLPPTMTKEVLLNSITPLPDYDFIHFVKADTSLTEFAFSRAYINFKNPTDIFIFKERFDNYVFLDAKGNEYPAVVEFAPFSHIPKKRNKKLNPKIGSIESDPSYCDFMDFLSKTPLETEEKREFTLKTTTEEDKNMQNTPLLEYVKQKRLDKQKLREEKREERKRRELERKRIKEEERKGRKTPHQHSIGKCGQNIKNAIPIISGPSNNVDIPQDVTNKDIGYKNKEKRNDEYRSKPVKEFVEKRPTYVTNKDHRLTEKKSPSKVRQRNVNLIEKDMRRLDIKPKRDEFIARKRDDKEDKIEKKVKKYSERREERKNEMKRHEAAKENTNKIDDTAENDMAANADVHTTELISDNLKGNCEKQLKGDKEDPRTQRRIRNKDRPSLAIYQPGMGLIRNKKQSIENCDPDQVKTTPITPNNGQSSKSPDSPN